MREILYRGKRVDCGDWTYGCYYIDSENIPRIVELVKEGSCIYHYKFPIIPETRGEYTGLCDKNGTKIFEGDILAQKIDNDYYVLGVVRYGEGTFDSGYYRYTGFFYEHPANGSHDHTNIVQSKWLNDVVEVIGNIYDNKNLLEDKNEMY